MMSEQGPVYGIELIESMPVGGGLLQAMPSASDLEQIQKINQRVVAGYEVLLSAYYKTMAKLSAVIADAQVDREKLMEQVSIEHTRLIGECDIMRRERDISQAECAELRGELDAEKQAHNDGLREYAETIGKRNDTITTATSALVDAVDAIKFNNDDFKWDNVNAAKQAAQRVKEVMK